MDPIVAGMVPATGPSNTPPAAGPTSTPSSDPIVAGMAAAGGKAPAPVAPSIGSLVANTPAPKDTSSLFSKFTSFLGNTAGKVSDAISSAIAPPDPSKLGSNAGANMLKFLPSELARNIVPGVAELQDDPSIAKYVTPSEVASSVPGAVGTVAKGFAAAPIKAAADIYDTGRVLVGKNPNASFTLPVLGKITSDVLDATTAIQNGTDPVVAALNAGSSSIFNVLFFSDIVNRVAGPRNVKVAETTGNVNDYTKGDGTGPRPVIDPGPKSGRIYEAPTAHTGAQVLPPEALAQMKEQGIHLGSNFDPKQPVFFKVTVGKGGVYTGEMIQIKPSYLRTMYDSAFGTKTPTDTLPAMLSGSEPGAPLKSLSTPDMKTAIENAPDNVVTVLHSASVDESSLVKAANDSVAKTAAVTETKPTAVAPITPPAPAAPSTTEIVSHNAIRLLGGDTAHATKGAAILEKEIQKAVAEHGAPATIHALTEKIGVDAPTAQKLVAESQAKVKVDAHAILKDVIGHNPQAPIDIAPAEKKSAAAKMNNYHVLYQPGKVGGTAPKHLPISGKPVDLEVPGVTHEFFIHRTLVNGKPGDMSWTVSERSTGMSLFSGGEPTQKAAIAKAREIIKKAGPKGVENAVKMQIDRHGITPSEAAKPKTQKDKIIEAVAAKPLSIKEVAEQTKILEPNVRRILGVGTKAGTFERVSEGVYVLKTEGGNFAYVEMGDAEQSLARMAEEGQKFDAVILDPAYYSRALIGGNRGIKQWNFIQAPEFANVMKSVSALVKTDDTHVYLMLSGARTAQPDMTKYVDGAVAAGFKAVGEGTFTKLNKDGSPSTNVRGVEAAAERLILLTKSGEARKGSTPTELHFRFVRVLGKYQTEKPAELMKALIDQSTIKGETVLDPFAGSGVTGAEALKAGRNAVLVEKKGDTVENVTKPRVEAAAKEIAVGDTVTVAKLAGNSSTEKYTVTKMYDDGVASLKSDTTGKTKNVTKGALRKVQSTGRIEAMGGSRPRKPKPKEVAAEEPVAEEPQRPINPNRGFVSLDPVAKSIDNLQSMIEHHQEVGEIVDNISQSIYQAEGANKALKVRLIQLVTEARTQSTRAERTNVYHYMEDHSVELTDNERKNVLPLVEAMDKTLEDLRAKAREDGLYITGDILGEHTPRNAVEKGGVIDKALDAYREGKKIISNGGKLSTSVGSGSKHRVYHSLTDENGKRSLVAIKDGKVIGIRNKVSTELGSTAKIISPKVKEFFDKSVMEKLETLAKDLGIKHERHATGKTAGLGGKRAGVSFQGEDLIKTRLSPDQVLAHEIGHQIDHKYGMQDFFLNSPEEWRPQLNREARALADKRFEGTGETSENFKKYVRGGSEKMAVMFEAYVQNSAMFKQTAPLLYDTFRQFLSDHKELEPFLDIKPSLVLGSKTHGGEHLGGITGHSFVDNAGKKYTVGQATTKEIEANTSTRYYKDPLANYALQIERTARATRAFELLTAIKESPVFKNVIVKEGEGNVPKEWVQTKMPQFRGYWMDQHLAYALDDMTNRQDGRMKIPIYDAVNNLMVSVLVINPIMHFPNVAVGWSAAAAGTGVIPTMNFMETFKQVRNKDPEYLRWVEKGAPFQYLRDTNSEFAEALLKDFTDVIKEEPDRFEELSNLVGKPVEWVKAIEKFSSDATWVGNDVMLFHALKEYQKANNSTEEKAIAEVSKRMADYRIPPKILGSRALSVVTQNNALFMFMRFHYSGTIKPWLTTISDSIKPGMWNVGNDPKWNDAERTANEKQQRMAGLRVLAWFAMLYYIYQLADKGVQKATGNPNAYISMAGPMKIPQNITKSIESQSPAPVIQGVLSLNPALKWVGSWMMGIDWNNFNKPIYGPGGEGLLAMTKNSISPYNAVAGAFTGIGSWTDFALSLGGIYSPKTSTAQALFNTMLNVERPQVEAAMKAKIVAGDTAGATALAKDFNDRLKVAIKNADLSNGNSGSDARVQYYFDTYPNGLGQKGYAIRMPSAQSITNYEAKQGLTTGQKYLPGSGNIQTTVGAPSDINNTTRPGTIRTVTANGVTIYNRLTNASAVKAAMMGGKITPGYQMDHIVPLEGGGTNEITNLAILTTAEDNINQPVEDFIGQQVRGGGMNLAQATEIAIRFKAGLGEKLSPSALAAYANKYGSQPLNLAQVYDYKHTVAGQ